MKSCLNCKLCFHEIETGMIQRAVCTAMPTTMCFTYYDKRNGNALPKAENCEYFLPWVPELYPNPDPCFDGYIVGEIL